MMNTLTPRLLGEISVYESSESMISRALGTRASLSSMHPSRSMPVNGSSGANTKPTPAYRLLARQAATASSKDVHVEGSVESARPPSRELTGHFVVLPWRLMYFQHTHCGRSRSAAGTCAGS